MVVALSVLALCALAASPAATGAPPAQPATPVVPVMTVVSPGGAPLAVLPLRSEGLQLNEAQRLDGFSRARAAALGGYAVQTAVETTALLEAAQALGIKCDLGEAACGAQIGQVAAVDLAVVGRAARVAAEGAHPGGVGLELVLVDVGTQAVLRRALALLPDDPAAQAEAFEAVARLLFAGDGAASWLVLGGGAPDARVRIDGVDVGALPLPRPLAGVIAGAHILEVHAAGFLPWRSVVTTADREPTLVDVRLVVDPASLREVASPQQIAVTWSVGGAGALIAIAGGIASAVFSQSWFAHDAATRALADVPETSTTYVGEVAARHQAAAAVRAEWEATGAPGTAVGITALAVGVVGAIGGTIWGTMLILGNEPATIPP